MKNKLFISFVVLSFLGCARVRVEAPKEPIKLDVTMRLDIYQHIEKDIDAIENMVTGGADKQSWLDALTVKEAYAEEGLSPEIEAAALRRKDRRSTLTALEAQGAIGENAAGLVEVKGGSADASSIVSEENNDRMVIYQSIAAKNGTSVEEVEAMYAKRLQNDAPVGTPIQIKDEASGNKVWMVK